MNLLLPSIKDFWANFIIINMFGIYLADAKSIVANAKIALGQINTILYFQNKKCFFFRRPHQSGVPLYMSFCNYQVQKIFRLIL